MLRGEKKRKPVDPYRKPTKLRKMRDREREEELDPKLIVEDMRDEQEEAQLA